MAAYEAASLLTWAAPPPRGGTASALLLIHGTADDNVYFMGSLRLADALGRAAHPSFQLFPIAGVTHQLYAPDTSGPAWTTAVLHFRRHLGPPEAVRWRHAALPQGSARSVLARSRKASAMMVKVQLEWPLVGNTLLLTM